MEIESTFRKIVIPQKKRFLHCLESEHHFFMHSCPSSYQILVCLTSCFLKNIKMHQKVPKQQSDFILIDFLIQWLYKMQQCSFPLVKLYVFYETALYNMYSMIHIHSLKNLMNKWELAAFIHYINVKLRLQENKTPNHQLITDELRGMDIYGYYIHSAKQITTVVDT